MITVYTAGHAQHNPPNEFLDGELIPYFESPARAEQIIAAVERAALGPIVPPRSYDDAPILAVHDAGYLRFLATIYERWVAYGATARAVIPSNFPTRWMSRPSNDPLAQPGYYLFDGSAPITASTYAAVRSAADVALTGAELLLEGQRAAYALCRPPGHHACSDMGGGYCYLNNAAIAAQRLRAAAPRVAVLDIDFHHGNGTQQIFYQRDDVLVASIHGDPANNYPYFAGFADERGAGAGQGYNLNIPLSGRPDNQAYMAALEQAAAAVAAYRPGFLVVSVGLDTYAGDPVAENGAGFGLTEAAYPPIGARIAALGLPTLFVQEGGYAVDALGSNLAGLLLGYAQATPPSLA